MAPATPDRLFLAKVYGFKFLDGFLLIYPLYGVMFVEHGLTPFQVSLTLMAWATVGFLLQIPSGVLADRFSRRWLLAGAQAVKALCFVAWLLWPNFGGYLLGLMLWGVKSAFTNGTFEALVYDELNAQGRSNDYARIMGRAQAAGAASVLAASLSAAWTVGFGYPAILVASFAASLAAAAAAIALPRARRSVPTGRADYLGHLTRGVRFAVSHAVALMIIALLGFSQAFGGGLEGFWPIFAAKAGLPHAAVALFAAAIGAAQALGAILAHRLRGQPDRLFHVLALAMGLVLALAAAVFQPWTVGLIVLLAGAFKVIDVNFDARLHAAIPTEMRATLASVRSFAGQVAMTGVLAAFGALSNATSYPIGFMACGAAMALSGVAFLVAGRRV